MLLIFVFHFNNIVGWNSGIYLFSLCSLKCSKRTLHLLYFESHNIFQFDFLAKSVSAHSTFII